MVSPWSLFLTVSTVALTARSELAASIFKRVFAEGLFTPTRIETTDTLLACTGLCTLDTNCFSLQFILNQSSCRHLDHTMLREPYPDEAGAPVHVSLELNGTCVCLNVERGPATALVDTFTFKD